ncbi:MAG: hypothetical protein GXO28_00215 [Methanopyri archaeon]|nr:hypothetical protein [Methanopyri archaeon]
MSVDVLVEDRDGDVVLVFASENGSIEVSTRAFYSSVCLNRENPLEKTKELLENVMKMLGEDDVKVRFEILAEVPEDAVILNPWVDPEESEGEVHPVRVRLETSSGEHEFVLLVPVERKAGIKELILKVVGLR